MKIYATLALILSLLVLILSAVAVSDIRLLTLHEIAPYLVVYTFGMSVFAVAAFVYVRKMERRRLTKRRW